MPDAYPLQWPAGSKRWDGPRENSRFKMTPGQMKEHLFDELDHFNAHDIVISTNRPQYSRSQQLLDDPGVAVYFKRKGKDVAFACDKYRNEIDNLHAIGITLQAFRTIERHATGEMVDAAFTGFKALPDSIIVPPPGREPRQWFEVLEVKPDASAPEVKQAYRKMQALTHPDAGGTQGEFEEVQQAYEEWRKL